LAELFAAEVCAIAFRENDDRLEISLSTKTAGKFRQLSSPAADKNVATRALRSGRVLNLPSASANDLAGLPLVEGHAGASVLTIPIEGPERPTGVIILVKGPAGGVFSPEDETQGEVFAKEIATTLAAIGRREKLSAELDRLKWENKRLRLVIESAPLLLSAQDLRTPLERLLEEAGKGIPFDKGAVYFFEERRENVKQLASVGYTPEEAQLLTETFNESLASQALHENEPVYVADVSTLTGGLMTAETSVGSSLAVPISIGETTYGVVSLGSDEKDAFEAEDVAFVKALAACAAAAVENARRLEREKKRARQLNLINEIGKKALLSSSTHELYREIAEATKNKFGYYNVAIYSVDARADEFFLETIVGGYADHLPVGHRQRRSQGLAGAAAEAKRAILVNDVTKDHRFFAANPSLMETKSELCVPVISRGDVAAVIDVQSRRVGAFEESDTLLLETLADQMGVIIENAALLREERERASEISLIGDLGKEILAARDIPALIRTVSAAIRKHFQYFNVSVFLVDPNDIQTIIGSVVEGAYEKALKSPPRIKSGEGFVGWAVEKGEIAFSNDATQDPRYAPDPIPGETRSEIAVPIKIGDRVVGVLDVQENAKDALNKHDVELLRTFADQLAVAIQNVNLFGNEQKATRNAETLLHISHIISQTPDLEKSLEFLVEQTRTVMDADAAVLVLRDEGEERIKYKTSVGLTEEAEELLRSGDLDARNHPLFEKAAASTKPLLAADLAADSEKVGDPLPGLAAQSMAVAAVRKKERLLGFLVSVWQTPPSPVAESDLALFGGIAFQTAIAVENLRYLENVKRQTDYLAILSSIAADAGRLPPLEEMLDRALDRIRAFANLDAGAIHLYDVRRRSLALIATAGDDEEMKKRWEGFESIGSERVSPLLEDGTITKEKAVDADPFELPPADAGGPASFISIPLVAKRQVLGRLTLFSRSEVRFRREDVELLKTICDQLSVFIENAQLFAQNASRMEELVTLLGTSKTLSSSLDTEEIIYNIAQKVKELIGADACTVFLLDRETGILEPIVSLTAYPEEVMKIRLKLGEGITGHVALTGKGEYVNDAGFDHRSLDVPGTPLEERESLLCVPLISREEVIGVMTLGRLGGEVFTDRDLQLVTLFAGQVAGSVENARLFDRVLSSMSIAEEHRRKSDAVFASIADAIVVTDMGLRVAEVNPAAEKMLGRRAETIINRHVRSILETPALHETFEKASGILQEKDVAEFELAVSRPGRGSKPGYYRVLVNAVTNPSGERVGYVATFRDVTEAKELAFLKENFIANVSHELRTPLTSIIGSAELIMADDKAGTFPYSQFVRIIEKEARRLRELVDSILDFSLLESRRLELKLEAVDVNDLVKETTLKYQQMADRNGISLEFAPAEDIPGTYADPNLVRSALANLIKNAIQFNSAGGRVRVSTEFRDGEIALAVADDGPGIAEDQLNTIFSTFYQVDGSSTRAVGGTGLGLTIAQRAIESHGGRIDVTSKIGAGSTFTIVLPIRTELTTESA
jgi:PAS domain S-box-containing protein